MLDSWRPDTSGLNYRLQCPELGNQHPRKLAAIANRDPDFAGWSYWFTSLDGGDPTISEPA